MEGNEIPKGILVTGVIGEDVHNIGIGLLEHALRKAGFKIVSLGIRTSQEEFINAAKETNADAILISSLSGHARALVEGFRQKCTEAGLKDILLYIGGHLVIGEYTWQEIERIFNEEGFNGAYSSLNKIAQIVAEIEAGVKEGVNNSADKKRKNK
jgi:methylaspartate mutase sigma subunit